jgi:protein phosphatase
MKKNYSYLSSFALTDQGLKRKNNEDSFAVFADHGVFCVADGMGGAEDGEVASKAAIQAISDMLKQFDPEKPLGLKAMQAWLCHALNEASYWMSNQTLQFGKKCMGTTIAGVCFNPESPNVAMAFHAGDSRVYHFHKGSIKQVTLDHNFANAAGIGDENELSPQYRNVILRAVGLEDTVDIEMTEFKVEQGDTIIVCSDGLTKMVSDQRIEEIIANALTVEDTTRVLVEEALKNGGKDNVTVVAVNMGQLPEPFPSELLTMRMPPIVHRTKTSSSTNNSSGTPDTDQPPIPQKDILCVNPGAEGSVPATPSGQKKKISAFLRDLSHNPLKATGILFLGIVVIRASFLVYDDGNTKKASNASGQPVRMALEATNNVENAARIATEEKRKKDEEERRAAAERAAKLEERRITEENVARIAAEEKRKKDDEIRKAEAERVAKLEVKRKAEENAARIAAEEKRKAEAIRVAKLEEMRKADANMARVAAEEKRKKDEEKRKTEAIYAGKLEEKRKADANVARLAAENKAKDEKQNSEWESVVQVMALVENEGAVSAYFHFMGTGMNPAKVSEFIAQYDEARGVLAGWRAPTKESLPEYTGDIKIYVNVLRSFVNTKAVQHQKSEVNKDGSGVANESKKTWEALLSEAQKLSKSNMEEGYNRKRLVAFVHAIAKYASPARPNN